MSKKLNTNVHSCIIHSSPKWEALKYQPADKLINVAHSYNETYLTIKINEILMHATRWVNPENIILSKRG